jgi:hypothetical protein
VSTTDLDPVKTRKKIRIWVPGLDEAILSALGARKAVTFLALCAQVPGFAGERFIAASGHPNLVLWDSISPGAALALSALLREKKVHYQITSALSYEIEGRILALPLATAFRKYDERRWLPVTLHPGGG